MDGKKIYGRSVIALTLACLGVIQACRVREIPECPHYPFISGVNFYAFIPVGTMDEICNRLQTAFDCAFEKLQNCPPYARLPFEVQRGVPDALCVGMRKEYLESAACFGKSGLRNRIAKGCLAMLATSNSQDACSGFKWVAECARETTMMTDGCSSSDGAFMKQLMDIFLQPTADIQGCKPLEIDVTVSSDSKEKTDEKRLMTSASDKIDGKDPPSTDSILQRPRSGSDSEEKDDNRNEEDDGHSHTTSGTMTGDNEPAQTPQLSATTESDSEDGSRPDAIGKLQALASTGSKSQGSSSGSKRSKSTLKPSQKKGTTSTANRKSSLAPYPKTAATSSPKNKQMTTSKSQNEKKSTDKSEANKPGFSSGQSDGASNGAARAERSGEPNAAAGVGLSCLISILVASCISASHLPFQ